MPYPSILIASPIRDRAWILPMFLQHLEKLDYPASQLSFFFLVNDCQDDSLEHVLRFRDENMHRYASIQVVYRNYGAEPDGRNAGRRRRYPHMAMLRNLILDAALYSRPDYLFSVDSDILVRSNVLSGLLQWDLPIVSSLIHNDRNHNWPDERRYYNVMREDRAHPGRFVHIRGQEIRLDGGPIVEVGATGAVVLMDRDAYSLTRYDDHPQGEDLAWSISAKKAGFRLYCDVTTPSLHVMDPEDLKLVREGRLRW